MFASCIREASHLAGRCVIECSPKLRQVFAQSFPGCEVRAAGSGWVREGIDAQLATGSLPRLFRRTTAAFPAHAGYLRPDAEEAAAWQARLRALGGRPKVALSWRGGTRQTRQARRSLEVDVLARALRELPVDFVSLQYGEVEDDLRQFADAGLTVHHWPEAIADYAQTAALLAGIDLVLSVCTALIHLGGALGRPVWVLAPAFPEWRYGDTGEEMPWYPSVRILRQPAGGDWSLVLAEVADRLSARFPR